MVAREACGAREAERETLPFPFFSFSIGARCSNQAKNYFRRGAKIFCLLPGFSGFILHCFGSAAVPLCLAVLALFWYIQHIKNINYVPHLGYV